MVELDTMDDSNFIGLCLEGFFFGLYSGVFAMYLKYQGSNKETNSKTRNVIFCCICALYVLSAALFLSDILGSPIIFYYGRKSIDIGVIQATLFACCDLIAQFILIYRCWIIWGCNIRIVIIPSVLAIAFLATWVATSSSEYFLSHQLVYSGWLLPMFLSSLTLSLTVNALVTGLIVLRIYKVFLQVETASDQILATTGGSKLRRIIFIIIESGMALFSIQLARLVTTILPSDAASSAFQIFVGIHEMLNGITPTIILVRTSMGLSFHDEKSMEEVAIGSLHFASNHLNSVSEMESIGIVGQDRRDDDDIDIQQSNDIEVVER